jgi:hypothetical protein
MDNEVLKKAEPTIRQVAGKFFGIIDGFELDDLMQNGRFLAWQLIVKKNISIDNFESYTSYLFKALNNSYINDFRRTRVQKRIRLSEVMSLYKKVGFEEKMFLYEVIPNKIEGKFTLETLSQISDAAIECKKPKVIKGVVRYFLELLEISPEEAPRLVNCYTFFNHGLKQYLRIFFKNSPYRALKFAYPDITPENMKRVPNKYWGSKAGKQRAIAILKKLLLEGGHEQAKYPLIVNDKFICGNGLNTPYKIHFKKSPFAFLDAAFPSVFMPWEMAHTPAGYFKNNNGSVEKAVYWLVEEKLAIPLSKMDKKDIWRKKVSKKLTKRVMEKYGLSGLLDDFKNSPEALIRAVYPDKFYPWDFSKRNKWNGAEGLELAAMATRWVIEDYADLSPTSEKICYKFFTENGFHGMMKSKNLGFNSSSKAALKNAYPDRFI